MININMFIKSFLFFLSSSVIKLLVRSGRYSIIETAFDQNVVSDFEQQFGESTVNLDRL